MKQLLDNETTDPEEEVFCSKRKKNGRKKVFVHLKTDTDKLNILM